MILDCIMISTLLALCRRNYVFKYHHLHHVQVKLTDIYSIFPRVSLTFATMPIRKILRLQSTYFNQPRLNGGLQAKVSELHINHKWN